MKGYLASHFFNEGMFMWTENLAKIIRDETGLDLYVPQENGEINDKKNNDDIITDIKISKADTAKLKESNILIACLDGLTIDDGVAAEIMAHGVMREFEMEHGIDFPRLIIGIITDMRYIGTGENKLYRNLMIVGKVKEHGHLLVGYPKDKTYVEELISIINDFIKENSWREASMRLYFFEILHKKRPDKRVMEATTRFELVIKVLQTCALPLGYVAITYIIVT